MGLKMSSKAQNFLMLIKITMIIVLIAALFFPIAPIPGWHTTIVAPAVEPLKMSWIQSLGIRLIAVSFTSGGSQQTINFGNEVANPAKNIPRGIFIGIAIIIGLYLLVNLSYFHIIGFENMKGEREIAYSLMNKVFGKTGAEFLTEFYE